MFLHICIYIDKIDRYKEREGERESEAARPATVPLLKALGDQDRLMLITMFQQPVIQTFVNIKVRPTALECR